MSPRSIVHRSISWSSSLALALAIAGTGSNALARPKIKPKCVVAFEQAQEKRKKGRLNAAKEQLLSCAQRSCGEVVQRECTTLLDQVRLETPSVVFSLTDSEGKVLTDAQVRVNGALLASQLDGRAVSVDPGTHIFSFKTREGRTIEQVSTIFEGVANQRVAVTFPLREIVEEPAKKKEKKKRTLDPIDPAGNQRGRSVEPPKGEDSRRRWALPWVFGGVGVAGLGGFFTLGALRNSTERDLRACWPECSASRVQRVRTLAIAANVSLGVSGAAFATSVVLFLRGGAAASSEHAKTKRSTAYAVDVQSFDDGVIAKVSGTF